MSLLHYLQRPKMLPSCVADLSHWEADADLEKAKADGIKAVILRATYGLEVDDSFVELRARAEAAGLPFGIYHFLRGAQSITDQADLFLKTIGISSCIPSKRLLVMDFEPDDYGTTARTAQADQFLSQIVASVGTIPVVYGDYSHLGQWCQGLPYTSLIRQARLWVAIFAPNVKIPEPWTNFLLHQYTDGKLGPPLKKSVDGIGPCDLNHLNVASESDLWTTFGYDPSSHLYLGPDGGPYR